MSKKLLTLDDLYRFYSTKKKSMKFSADKTGEPIVVQVEGKINFEKDETAEGLTAVTLQACHTEKNLNKSSISFETMQNKMLPTFKNRPILGYIHEVDGEPQFYGHNMHIDEESDEIVYDEITVGIIPETNNAKLEYDKENDRYNVIIDGYIFDDYTKAVEILEREQECSVSVEIAIKEMSYSAKDKCLEIQDGYFSGVTILGMDENGNEVKPGMAGSNIRLKDFAESNNSIFSDMTEEEHSKLIDTLERLNSTLSNLSNFNIDVTQNFSEDKEKGGNDQVTKFEELLNKYNKTQEDITFDIEGLSDEDLEAKFAEVFEDNSDDNTADNTDDSDNGVVENNSDEMTENEVSTTSENTNEESEESDLVETDAKKKKCEVETNENSEEVTNFSKTFELSHEDVRSGLYGLLAPYEEADNEWYWIVSVYDNYFVYQGMMGNYWGQKYTVENDNISFDGERYELFAEFVTQSEKAELEQMRSNYSSIQAELNTYKEAEEKADKMTVFNDESYSNYLDTEEFKELMSDDSLKKFTKEELTEKADAALGKLVKKTKTFSLNTENNKKSNTTSFFAFAKQENDSSFLDSLLKK